MTDVKYKVSIKRVRSEFRMPNLEGGDSSISIEYDCI
jgi:hypothetical protein